MNRVWLLALVLLVVSACGAPEEVGSDEPEILVTYFENGTLILGDGSAPIEDGAFIVTDGIITAVGPKSEVAHPPGADRFDLSDHTVMPFLYSIHSHVGLLVGSDMAAENYTRDNILLDLDRYLYYGVGTIGVMGSDAGDVAFEIRSEQVGNRTGTQLLTAGRGITARRGWPTNLAPLADIPYQVGTEDEAREAVRELVANNVDFIKVWVDDGRQVSGQIFRAGRLVNDYSSVPKLSPALYGAIIDEAHQNNTRVVAHVRYLNDAKGLVDAGIDGLVHSIRDRDVDDALIEAMLANDVFYVPTLTAHQAQFIYADEPDWVGESPMRESVSPAVVSRISSRGFVGTLQQDLNLPGWRAEFDTAMRNVKKIHDAGVPVGLGTDSGTTNKFPGYFEHRELELLVEAGVAPLQAIQIAVHTTAQLLGLGDAGGLLVGMRGDFFLVPDDPLDQMSASRNIAEVFFGGRQVERSAMMTRFTR